MLFYSVAIVLSCNPATGQQEDTLFDIKKLHRLCRKETAGQSLQLKGFPCHWESLQTHYLPKMSLERGHNGVQHSHNFFRAERQQHCSNLSKMLSECRIWSCHYVGARLPQPISCEISPCNNACFHTVIQAGERAQPS